MTITQMISEILMHNTVYNYILSLISIILFIVIGKYANALIERLADKLHKKSGIELDELLIRALSLPVAIAIILSGFYFGVNFLYLLPSLKTAVNEGILTAFILCVVVFLTDFLMNL